MIFPPSILSHPKKTLHEHLSEVWETAQHILKIRGITDPWIIKIVKKVCWHHDDGKSTAFFQKYIRDTKAYKAKAKLKDLQLKSHAPIGALMYLLIGDKEPLTETKYLNIIAIASIIRGHHSRLPHIKKLPDGMSDDDWSKIYREQLDNIPQFFWDQQQITNPNDFKTFRKIWKRAKAFLDTLCDNDLMDFRVRTQMAYSVLLEADKAFLKFKKDKGLYLEENTKEPTLDQVFQYIKTRPQNELTSLRNKLQEHASFHGNRMAHVKGPTGGGKTLLSYLMALKNGTTKVIYSAPYLSINEQTEAVFREILGSKDYNDGLISFHSIAVREYNHDSENLKDDYQEFFLDTWRAKAVVTTFDQLYAVFFSPKARHQMRFSALYDATIILDEVQTLPCGSWDLLGRILESLIRVTNLHVIPMSATMPPIFPTSIPALPPKLEKEAFDFFNRYTVNLDLNPKTVDDFVVDLNTRRDLFEKRLLITLNTRKSAREVFKRLKDDFPPDRAFLISREVTPKERKEILEKISDSTIRPLLIVSTQCIEAGVDISMDYIIRDMAPLDRLIQIAGRCMRERIKANGIVEVVLLVNEKGRPYWEMVYKEIAQRSATLTTLAGITSFDESEIVGLCDTYFKNLNQDKGTSLTKDFIRWKEIPSVRMILERIDYDTDFRLILGYQDPTLKEDLKKVLAITQKWERYRALRKISPRLSKVEVTLTRKEYIDIESQAEKVGDFLFWDQPIPLR